MNIYLIMISVLALLSLPAAAQTVVTTTLDVGIGGDVGRYTSQAIVNGHPAIG